MPLMRTLCQPGVLTSGSLGRYASLAVIPPDCATRRAMYPRAANSRRAADQGGVPKHAITQAMPESTRVGDHLGGGLAMRVRPSKNSAGDASS
jgi:hypothetical protein